MLKQELLTELEKLSEMDEESLSLLCDTDKENSLRLLMALGSIITKTCGSHTKLHEKTTQLRLAIAGAESVHVKHSYGADLRVKDPESGHFIDVEVKSSDVKKGKSYKSSWNFKIDSKATLETLRLNYSGDVRFTAIYNNTVLADYLLSGRFVALYLSKCLANGKNAVNMGSTYCEHHKTYHRMEKFIRYDALLKGHDDFTDQQWLDLFAAETATHTQ